MYLGRWSLVNLSKTCSVMFAYCSIFGLEVYLMLILNLVIFGLLCILYCLLTSDTYASSTFTVLSSVRLLQFMV